MLTDMGQVYCELPAENLSDQSDIQIEPASQLLDHGSISFGRFSIESLAWEKWSSFSQNRCLEEVQRCSAPGSVAKKKAYFEAYYKRIAAQKALQEQEELAQKASHEASQQALQGQEQSDWHFEDENNSDKSYNHHFYEDVSGLQTPEQNGFISEDPTIQSHDNATYFQTSEQLNEEVAVTSSINFDGSSTAHNHEDATVLHTCKQENDGNFVNCDNILQVSNKICASSDMIGTFDNEIANEEIGEEANQLVHSLSDEFQHEELLGEDLYLKNETQVQEDSDRVAFESQTDALILTAVTENGIATPVKHHIEELGRTDEISEEVEEKVASEGSGNKMTFDPKPLLLNGATKPGVFEPKEHDIQEIERRDGVFEEIEEKKIVSIHANVVSKKSKQSKESTLKESAASCKPKITKDHKLHSPIKVSVNSPQISKSQVLSGLRSTGNSTPRVSKSQIATGLISGNLTSRMSRSQMLSGVTSGNFTPRRSQTGLPSGSTSSGKAIPRTLPKTESVIVSKGNKIGGDKREGDRSTNCVNKLPNMRASQSNFTVPRPFSLATDKRASKTQNDTDKESSKPAAKVLQNRINVPRSGKTEVSSNKASKLPVTKDFHLEDGRTHRAPKIPVVNNCNKEKQAKDQGGSTISECSSSLGIVKPKPSPNVGGTTFSFRSNERAVKRQEFYTKLGEKMSAKEAEKNQLQAKTQEEKEAELIKLRKNLKFKATPMPNFYHEGVPPMAEIKKIPPTSATSPRFGRKNTDRGTNLSKSLQVFKTVPDQENKNSGLGEKHIYMSGVNRDALPATNSSSLSKKVPSSSKSQMKKELRHVLFNDLSKTEGKNHSEGKTSLKKSEADGVKLVSTNLTEDPYPSRESSVPALSREAKKTGMDSFNTIPKVLNASQDMDSTEDSQI
ncbi:uncharacterized protein LOC131060118 [Cryptomeria japonica]|uniref:uncharacterized protein LOC131060118 n=1 Tax=Cryptomeria japonica TaxID=3369 RepID=UPI0027DA2891|nr:uncharacterized protein LOC131060118 [Cryptomeria japonica]XP_057849208.2 uncharacterized protein LOC131060118 [Cryptomeria japonica]XP_057849209.2 uncharacterized protein LOC131060118 [Cryptomeria japonica]